MLLLNFLKQDLDNLKVGAISNKTMISYLVRSLGVDSRLTSAKGRKRDVCLSGSGLSSWE